MAELRQRLGEFLGLPGAAPGEVLLRALDDPGFETDLITARGAPGFLRALFDHPRTRAYAAPGAAAPAGNGQLVARAAGAIVRWGKAGFATADLDTLTRREDACLACPHLTDPQAAVQKLSLARGGERAGDRVGSRTGRKVCGLCGCVVSRKIRMATESCPDAHPVQAGLTRWDEPAAGPRAAKETGG
jgi:hypothetical protein